MPSSQAALKAKIAQLEAIVELQNNAMDEMGRLIDDMNGGLVAKLKRILERHGVKFRPERPPL